MILRFASLAGIVLGAVLIWLCSRGSESGQVTFRRFDPFSFQNACQDGKPILLYVTGTADAASEEQNRGALRDERVIKALEPFARFKILSTGSNPMAEVLLSQMPNPTLPVFVFMTPQSAEVAQLSGLQSADALIAAAAKVSKAMSDAAAWRAGYDGPRVREQSVAIEQSVQSARNELEGSPAPHSRRSRRER